VVHGFWVPSLGIRETLIPGVTSQKQILLENAGRYKIACSEMCGAGHAKMTGWIHVLPKKE
jgi:cytochrome c oxidase subunit 2